MGEPAVALRDLVKLYDTLDDGAPPSAKATEGRKVLDLPELDLEAGRVHVVVGPNGAGKTTLLRMVNGLEQPSSGQVRVLGTELRSARRAERLELRRRMAFCPEKPYLFQTSVRRNVEYPLRVRGVSGAERRPLSEAAMAKLGVEELAGRDARTLSAGETQRVAIARAIACDPELLLLDDPLANVDARAVPLVEDTIVELASRGVTVVVATHVLEQAYRLSANVVRLEGGRIAPPAVENIIEGEITGEGTSAVLVLDGGTAVHVVTERRGHARASVDPRDIIVSPDKFGSSARNLLPARVVSLRERGGLVYVTGEVGPDGRSSAEAAPAPRAERSGLALVSELTPESCAKLALTVGSEVVFAFKATDVKVFWY